MGAVLSNLYLSFFSTLSDGETGRDYSHWLLQQADILWRTFQETFIAQWNNSGYNRIGDESYGLICIGGWEYEVFVLDDIHIRMQLPSTYPFFLGLCGGSSVGDLYPASIFNSPQLVASAQQSFLQSVWRDSLGFTGAKMVCTVNVLHSPAFTDQMDILTIFFVLSRRNYYSIV